MRKGIVLTRTFAIAGTVLAGFPILATVATSIIRSAMTGKFLLDYLMPAELFLAALAGGLLLLWAAFRAQQLRMPVIIGLVSACVFLAASQLTAVWSGLAHGDTEPVGLIWGLVIAFLVLYTAAVVELAVTGIVLTKKIFNQPKLKNEPQLKRICRWRNEKSSDYYRRKQRHRARTRKSAIQGAVPAGHCGQEGG